MDIYELIAVKRDEILSLAERFGIKNIRIFGSVARHEAGRIIPCGTAPVKKL